MRNGAWMLMGATALLYLGPFAAGLGGFGWVVTPLFVAIFLLRLFIRRPDHWPRKRADWSRPEALINLFAQSFLQLVIVAIMFAIGRTIWGLTHTVTADPAFPLLLPITISALAIPIGITKWNFLKPQRMSHLLDDAIARVHGLADTDKPDPGLDLARSLIAPLADLPDDTPNTEIARGLLTLYNRADPTNIRHALLEACRDQQPSRAEIIALILHSTDPDLIIEVPGDGPTLTLALLPDDPDMIAFFANRLAAALDTDASVWGKCPSVDNLTDLVAEYDNTAAEAPLRYLIAATDRAQPEDGLA